MKEFPESIRYMAYVFTPLTNVEDMTWYPRAHCSNSLVYHSKNCYDKKLIVSQEHQVIIVTNKPCEFDDYETIQEYSDPMELNELPFWDPLTKEQASILWDVCRKCFLSLSDHTYNFCTYDEEKFNAYSSYDQINVDYFTGKSELSIRTGSINSISVKLRSITKQSVMAAMFELFREIEYWQNKSIEKTRLVLKTLEE
jgi:hypothetical protein